MPKDRLMPILMLKKSIRDLYSLFILMLTSLPSDQKYPIQTAKLLGQAREPRKEKKINKDREKRRDPATNRKEEWNKFEQMTYARVLLKAMAHSAPITDVFHLYVGELLNKPSRQVYAFHKRMLYEFRSLKQAVIHLLGPVIKQTTSLRSDQENEGNVRMCVEESSKRGAIMKLQPLIDTDSSQLGFQSEDLNFVQNFLFVEKTPDQMNFPHSMVTMTSKLAYPSASNRKILCVRSEELS